MMAVVCMGSTVVVQCWGLWGLEMGNFCCWGDNGSARAYCACSRCGWGLFGYIFSLAYHFFFLSSSLWN